MLLPKFQIADGAGFDPSLIGYGHAEPWHWWQSKLGGTTLQSFHHQLEVRWCWCDALHSITPVTGASFYPGFEMYRTQHT